MWLFLRLENYILGFLDLSSFFRENLMSPTTKFLNFRRHCKIISLLNLVDKQNRLTLLTDPFPLFFNIKTDVLKNTNRNFISIWSFTKSIQIHGQNSWENFPEKCFSRFSLYVNPSPWVLTHNRKKYKYYMELIVLWVSVVVNHPKCFHRGVKPLKIIIASQWML